MIGQRQAVTGRRSRQVCGFQGGGNSPLTAKRVTRFCTCHSVASILGPSFSAHSPLLQPGKGSTPLASSTCDCPGFPGGSSISINASLMTLPTPTPALSTHTHFTRPPDRSRPGPHLTPHSGAARNSRPRALDPRPHLTHQVLHETLDPGP